MALAPILQMKVTVTNVRALADQVQLNDKSEASKLLSDCERQLKLLPSSEQQFKKKFDEYSEGISYKQQFLDKNAFLVYYTKGFDGPGRPSIETEDPKQLKEAQQFGLRNEAWIGVDDARAELSYLQSLLASSSTSSVEQKESVKDLKTALQAATKALVDYVAIAPSSDLSEAESILSSYLK